MRIILFLLLLAALIIGINYQAKADMGNVQPNYNKTPPAFGAAGDTTVSSSVEVRYIYGSILLASNAITAANITISICGGATLENFQSAPIASLSLTWAYAFSVTGGTCYRFNNNADPTGTNKISAYNYLDIINETFEGRTHANATWCNAVNSSCVNSTYANATFEGQAHANATWCPLTDCVNNTYVNKTVPPIADLDVGFSDEQWGEALLTLDGTPYQGTGDHIFSRITSCGPGCPFPFADSGTAESGVFIAAPRSAHDIGCPFFVDAYVQNMTSGAVSQTKTIAVQCNFHRQHVISYVSAKSIGDQVNITWQSDASLNDFNFEIVGGSVNPGDSPAIWNTAWWPWEFQPDWFCGSSADPTNTLCNTGVTRSFSGPISDVLDSNGTFMLIKLEGPDIDGSSSTGGQSFYTFTSCVIHFVADGLPHSCGTKIETQGNQTNCSNGCNGNFTGNFTGDVTDTSAIPVSIAAPLFLVGFAAAAVVAGFVTTRNTKNPATAFACLLAVIIGWIIVLTQAAPYLDANNYHVLVVAYVFAVVALAFRSYTLAVKTEGGEASGDV